MIYTKKQVVKGDTRSLDCVQQPIARVIQSMEPIICQGPFLRFLGVLVICSMFELSVGIRSRD